MEIRRITEARWAEAERRHRDVLEPITTASLERRGRGVKHPVYDFLFTYFSYPSAKLLRWHPGAGVAVIPDPGGSKLPQYMKSGSYKRTEEGWMLDPGRIRPNQRVRIEWIRKLCENVLRRGPWLGCFGLHEWAMVYRQSQEEVRHSRTRLRLSPREVDAVVDAHTLRCTHFDAFRFFTPPAIPRNTVQPQIDSRQEMEQPGCIHTNMDLYKWSYKLQPWGGSDLMREAFLLALKAREVDMRASPYDLEEFGFRPIPIETAAGRDEYVALQTELAGEARPVREKLMDTAERILNGAALAATPEATAPIIQEPSP